MKSLYHYDSRPLNAVVESTDDSSLLWRKEEISFDAAYGGDRVVAHLFLPKKGKPPYQTVVVIPGVDAVYISTFRGLPYGSFTEYIINSGRALLFPIYYGTYERPAARGRIWNFASVLETPWAYRDWLVLVTKDLGRCIDYLETRRDIDSERIAYYGVCHGAVLGPVNNLLIIKARAKVPVIVDAGVGTASDAAIAMESGADGVLMNTAIAGAQDPAAMALAVRHAVIVGRLAFTAGRIGKKMYASASSPVTGLITKG